MNLIRHNFLQHGLVQPPRNPTNKKQGGPLPVLNRVKWSDKLVTGLATPVSGVVTPLCSCVVCRFFQNNSQEVFMRQLLLALANWIGVLDFLKTFWNRRFDGIIALQGNLIQICICFWFLIVKEEQVCYIQVLGGGFKYFFSTLPGGMIQFD